jgi:hypothetical protein
MKNTVYNYTVRKEAQTMYIRLKLFWAFLKPATSSSHISMGTSESLSFILYL